MEQIKITPDDITVFVIESGEPSFKQALTAVNAQTYQTQVKIISNVTPMWKAFQQMLDLCETPYFVQVDADMILKPSAIETLATSFEKQDSSCCMYVGFLFDSDMDRNILGVKIYDHRVFKHFPYKESFSCEVFQLEQLKRFGYSYKVADLKSSTQESESLGKHSPSQTPEMAFSRWERNMLKYRSLGYDYLASYPKIMLDKVRSQPHNNIALAQLLGCVSGLVCEMDIFREVDASKKNEHFEILRKHLQIDTKSKT
jgi:hypothetical protein